MLVRLALFMKDIHIIKNNFSGLFFIDAVAAAVDGYDAGEIFDLETVDCFAEQIGESNECTFSDRVSVKRTRAADGGKIDGVIFDDGSADFVTAFTFADHGFQAQVKKARGKGVHARAGGRAAASARFPCGCGTGTGVINRFADKGKRKGCTLVEKLANAFVRAIAAGENGAGE